MEKRMNILTGTIKIREEYIIGKVIKNDNAENKKDYIQVLSKDNMDKPEIGYKAYVLECDSCNSNLDNYCLGVKDIDSLSNYDVIEIIKDLNIRVLYRDDSNDNYILVTNQCNSNCIMCPDADSVRNTKDIPSINVILDHIRAIPNDTSHITITGGEPGLLKDDLIKIFAECKKYLPNTEFLLLSNGRIFSNTEFVDKFKSVVPKYTRVGIPLYADEPELHDSITRADNSFKQAVCGIKKLLNRGIDVEIRIVVQKLNYKILDKIARFICNEIPTITMVNIMSLEMCGNAIINKNQIWVDYEDIKEPVYKACLELIKHGIIVNLYNFPLCALDERVYAFAVKSISDYKVRYREECSGCTLKKECGGLFNSTINLKEARIKPVK
ncbi:MAG: His-Xaa-Ser system radical SAM maturase HxsC [Clostridia bacterium]|nr:His-Xaa-Ser system radical SAM maturase HxsC [Bacilli bacterium]MBR3511470.1 His-Xaa-Ser system radical SAM maturase HxsC [Clostridia bacterium]